MHRPALAMLLARSVAAFGGCADEVYEVNPDTFSQGGDGATQADGELPKVDGAATPDVAGGNDTGPAKDQGSPALDSASAGADACVNPTSRGVTFSYPKDARSSLVLQ